MTASRQPTAPAQRRLVAARAIVALVVLAGALTLAPEDPRLQASICQRHHSVDACRVW